MDAKRISHHDFKSQDWITLNNEIETSWIVWLNRWQHKLERLIFFILGFFSGRFFSIWNGNFWWWKLFKTSISPIENSINQLWFACIKILFHFESKQWTSFLWILFCLIIFFSSSSVVCVCMCGHLQVFARLIHVFFCSNKRNFTQTIWHWDCFPLYFGYCGECRISVRFSECWCSV